MMHAQHRVLQGIIGFEVDHLHPYGLPPVAYQTRGATGHWIGR
jgi:hypothetical protein